MSPLSSVKGRWVLILGASSGFGEATAIKLSELGMNIAGVHLDRKHTLGHVKEIIQRIQSNGVKAAFFNVNAADAQKRTEVLDQLAKQAARGFHCVLHSLAFGTLKPFISSNTKESISAEQMTMTLDVMAHSLVYWVQDLYSRKLLARGARIFAMTSSGGSRVWPTYGAVSAAKAALESHCRQLALELAKEGVSVNAIRAGVTDTPALRMIPGHEKMIEMALRKSPSGRITTPKDVADALALLVHDEATWVTGNVIGVDGGEDIVG
ncbi:MAG: SDR family oxidoreductase [Deltaproteobacteria bacterium]|nr:SDR family oxidoreductase [Deltaproteobacteria bacterium]